MKEIDALTLKTFEPSYLITIRGIDILMPKSKIESLIELAADKEQENQQLQNKFEIANVRYIQEKEKTRALENEVDLLRVVRENQGQLILKLKGLMDQCEECE